MRLSLNVTGEVKVYIRRLVSRKAQEGLKGNVMSVGVIFGAAEGAILIGQVKA